MEYVDDDTVELKLFGLENVDAENLMNMLSEEIGDIPEDQIDAPDVNDSGKSSSFFTDRRGATRLSAITLKKGSGGRSSVLSVRPSLMSIDISDKLLEKVMENSSCASLRLSSIASTPSDMGSWLSDESNRDEKYGDHCAYHSISSKQHLSSRKSSSARISFAADPLLFGSGGTPIPMERNLVNGDCESLMFTPTDPSNFSKMHFSSESTLFGPPCAKKPYAMQFAVSRNTLDMFDEDFPDDSSIITIESSSSSERKPVNIVSNELRETYLNETEHVAKVQEDALAMEFNRLSFSTKDKINFEIHGVYKSEEEPLNVDEYLRGLEIELQSIVKDNDPYREAQRLNPDYVNSRDFRLMFLRMFHQENSFDVKEAAARMMMHFSVKKMIFGGGEILARDVRLSDLSKDDRAAMDSGAWQTMPDRDVAGRVVVFYAPGQRIFKTVENWMRAMWYMFYLIAKDEENQKSGMVMVVYLRGFTDQRDTFEQAKMITMVRDAIPQKFVGLHYCYNDVSMKTLVTAQKVHFLTRNHRSRSRDHLASHEDICFRLETYGIHIDRSILLQNGYLGLSWYNQWIKLREAAEADIAETDNNRNLILSTILPKKFDVLFGRGRNTREHCGNLRCAHLVESHQREYESCSKTEKTALANRIVAMVKESGGRFLKKDRKKGWEEVSDTKAREKVAHFFRHLRATTLVKEQTEEENLSMLESQKRPAQLKPLD